MKNVNKNGLHPNYAVRKSTFLSICVFFVCMICFLAFNIPQKTANAAGEYIDYFTVITDSEYADTTGGTISLDGNTLSDVLLKDHLEYARTTLGVDYVASAVANEGYVFSGWYFAESELYACEQNCIYVSDEATITIHPDEETSGFYIAYFVSTEVVSGIVFYNNFSATIEYPSGYDPLLIGEYADFNLIQPENSSGDPFDLSIAVSEYMDVKLELVRHGYVFRTYHPDDYLTIFNVENNEGVLTYSTTLRNYIAYNNFNSIDAVTYRFVMSPRLLTKTINWAGQSYYNVDSEITETESTFTGYYGESVLDAIYLEFLSNFASLTYPDSTTIFDRTTEIIAQFNLLAYKVSIFTEAGVLITSAMIDAENVTLGTSLVSGPIQSEQINADIYEFYGLGLGTECIITYQYQVNTSPLPRTNVEGLQSLSDMCYIGKNVNLYISLTLNNWEEQTIITENLNTFTINNESELVWFMNQVNSGNTFEGKTVELAANIDLSGKNWTPIGVASFSGMLDDSLTSDYNGSLRYIKPSIFQTSNKINALGDNSSSLIYYKPFKGFFNGNGKTISNVNIFSNKIYSGSTLELDGVGFFACVEDATIINLKLDGVNITGASIAGALCAVAINSTFVNNQITNSTIDFPIDFNKTVIVSLGGTIGVAYKCILSKIYSQADINTERIKESVVLASYIGGVVGESLISDISESVHRGELQVIYKNVINKAYSYIAGIAAVNANGTIENCLALTTLMTEGNNNYSGLVATATSVSTSLAYISDATIYQSPITLDFSAVGVLFGGVANNLVSVQDVFILTRGGISSQYAILGESKTDEELKTATTYTNWDSGIWCIENGNIPYLYSINEFVPIELVQSTTDNWKDYAQEEIIAVGDVYTIQNVSNLVWFMNQVNSLANNFKSKTIRLANNIDLSGREWTPIGCNSVTIVSRVTGDENVSILDFNQSQGFQGVFDGQGYVISGLTQSACINNQAGLFGYAIGALIKNLTLENVNIDCNTSKYTLAFDETSSPNYCVGALVAVAISSEIIECEIMGSSKINAQGVASANLERIIGILLKEISPVAVLQMRFAQLGQNATCVGGVVGLSEDCDYYDIQNSADVSGVVSGGVVGCVQGRLSFENGTNNGEVHGVIAGGIIGAEIGEMSFEKMWSFGIDTSRMFLYISSKYIGKEIEVSFVQNAGSIVGSSVAGGIIGGGQAYIKSAFNEGEIVGCIGLNGVSYSEGIASFGAIAGGIAGCADSVIDSYNIGAISTSSVPNIAYTSFKGLAGGIAGRANYVGAAYNNATVQCKTTRESLLFAKSRATEMAGGIVAFSQNTLSIVNVFNLGTIIGARGHKAEIFGVISDLEPFVLTEDITIDQKTLDVSNAYSNGSNDAYCYIEDSILTRTYNVKLFSNSASFVDKAFFQNVANWDNIKSWDFLSVWMFNDADSNYDYPILQNMNYSIIVNIVEDSGLENITVAGEGVYSQGQTIKVIATHPAGYYARWRLPSGNFYYGDVLDFRFNIELFGEYELSILPNDTESVRILAVFSDALDDNQILYGDEYGIRSNIVVQVGAEGELVYAGLDNVLPLNLRRENKYIIGWNTSEDGTGVDIYADTNFFEIEASTIYAVWASDFYNIDARVVNGNIETVSDHSKNYFPTETFEFATSNKYGYTFAGWRVNNEFVDSNNVVYGLNFVGTTLSVLVSDLAEWLNLNSAESVIIEAVYTNEVVNVVISSNDVNMGVVGFDEDYGTITYGEVVSISATEIEGARFQYWQDEFTGVKYYTQSGLILIATRSLDIKAYFVLNGLSVYVNASSNIVFTNATMGLNTVDRGEDFGFSFSVPEGYYLHSILIDDVAQELNNNILLENITTDHEIVIVIKHEADVYFTLESSISGITAYFSVIIGEKSYNFTLEHGQTKHFSGIEQMQTLVYYISVPTRFDYNVELDGAMLIENSITTKLYQSISVFVVQWTNDYLTAEFN